MSASEQSISGQSNVRLVCGLGNPGDKYEYTRHNIGFLIADLLLNDLGSSLKRHNEYLGDLASGEVGGRTVHILKPSTYMNLSGKSLIRTVNALSMDPRTNVLVVVDDVHLPFGQLRVCP